MSVGTARPPADSMAGVASLSPRTALRLRENTVRALSAFAVALPAIVAWAVSREAFALFAAIIAVLMLHEWIRLCGDAVDLLADRIIMSLGTLAAVLTTVLGRAELAVAIIAASCVAAWGLSLIRARRNGFWLGLGPLYVGLPIIALLWLYDLPEIGKALVLWVILTVVATDTGGYFAGRALRGPRLAPRLSPGKTWSGMAGGFVSAIAVGMAAGSWMELGAALSMAAAAFLVSATAQAGVLLESAMKRMFGVKDAGRLLPGHGGVLDRMDGLVAAAVFVACVIWLSGGNPRQWL